MSTNEKVQAAPQKASPDTAPQNGLPDTASEDDFYEEEFTPGEADGGMFGAVASKKAQHFWPSAKRLLGLLKPERTGILAVFAMVAVAVVLNVIAPRILGQAMDVIFGGVVGKQLPADGNKEQFVAGLRAQGQNNFADMLDRMNVIPGVGIDFARLAFLISVVLLMYFVANIFLWLQGYVLNVLVMRVVRRLRDDTEKKLNRLPLNYFDTRQRGDTLSRVTNDVDNIQQALQQAFAQLVNSALTVLGIVIMMFIVSWQLALIALVALPLSAVAAAIIGTRSQKLFASQWKNTGDLNGQIEESFSGHDLVRIFGRDADMLARFDERNEALYRASFGAQFVSGMIMPIMQFVSYLSYVGIAVVGGLRVASGGMSLGGRHSLHPVLPGIHPTLGPDGGHGQHAAIRGRLGRAGLRIPRRRGTGPGNGHGALARQD
jgi:ATP-binding cassette subfamily B multidrug efflux pump